MLNFRSGICGEVLNLKDFFWWKSQALNSSHSKSPRWKYVTNISFLCSETSMDSKPREQKRLPEFFHHDRRQEHWHKAARFKTKRFLLWLQVVPLDDPSSSFAMITVTLCLLLPWLVAAGVLPSGSLVPRRVVSGEWQEAWTKKEVWRQNHETSSSFSDDVYTVYIYDFKCYIEIDELYTELYIVYI